MQRFLERATILHPEIFGKKTVMTVFDSSDKATYDLFACHAAALFAADYSRSLLLHIDPSLFLLGSRYERIQLTDRLYSTLESDAPLNLILDGGRIVDKPSNTLPCDLPPDYIKSGILRLLEEAKLSTTFIGYTNQVRVSHSYISRCAILNHGERSLTTYIQDEID
jgi:hypothetical protein